MKIGMVTAVYKPVVNGVTHMIALYKDALEQLGHEVTVFTLGEPDPAGDEPNVIRSPAIPLGDYGYQIGFRYTREARELLRQMDILHCHHPIFGVDLAHRYGQCPVVLTNHTRHDLYTVAYLPLPQQAADAVLRQLWPEFTGMADVVIAPSESVRDVMIDFGVVEPIAVIPNGVDLKHFYLPRDPKRKCDFDIPESAVLAVYTGRLFAEKNMTTLIDQFAVAHDIVPTLHLLLVGHGPMRDDLSRQAQQLGINEYVHLIGRVDYKDLPGILAAADIYVTASVSEVHPLAVIEGMASGLAVAATRSPGIVDTIEHGVTGFLASKPERGLAAAIVALATNPDLRDEMGKAARKASEEYDIQHTVASTLDLYETLRRERPDLERANKHGRWHRPQSMLNVKLREIVKKIRLDDSDPEYVDRR